MILRAGYLLTALRLQEAADAISHGNVRSRLSDAVNEAHKGTGKWAYYVDHAGDGTTGDVIYTVDGGMKSAPYELGSEGKNATTKINTDKAKDVVPHVTYKPHTAKAKESDSAAGGGIEIPQQEGADASQSTGLKLIESAATVEAIVLREAKADYEIKVIAPGKGSSAFYPKEVLQRDGPKVFKAGTQVFLNHATAAEEAARPEGDVKNLAGVLTTSAVYHESHPKGPGLYARMKVFADHAQMVEEKAPHTGMSIRAGGIAEANRKQDGLPVLKELTHAESVDIVTRAGAGGMILTEGAKPSTTQQETGMDEAQIKTLIEAVVKPLRTENTSLLERALRGDARELATKVLAGVSLPEASKQRVIEAALRDLPKTEAGELDTVKFTEAVNATAKSEGEYVASLTEAGRVRGMGAGAATVKEAAAADPKEIAAREAQQKLDAEESMSIFESLGMPKEAAVHAAKFSGRAA